MRSHRLSVTVSDETLSQLQTLSNVQQRTMDDIIHDVICDRIRLMFNVWHASRSRKPSHRRVG